MWVPDNTARRILRLQMEELLSDAESSSEYDK